MPWKTCSPPPWNQSQKIETQMRGSSQVFWREGAPVCSGSVAGGKAGVVDGGSQQVTESSQPGIFDPQPPPLNEFKAIVDEELP
mmetsp:Transcript_20128/g.50347  ORF Transcript_20128/g.50347 Transcript_20128/m.50347 type:complete len:84 (+) Transcript_20128:2089-2340(+)